MLRGRLAATLIWIVLSAASAALSQAEPLESTSRVAVLDQQRLFDETDFGRATLSELQKRQIRLAAENAEIFAALEKRGRTGRAAQNAIV